MDKISGPLFQIHDQKQESDGTLGYKSSLSSTIEDRPIFLYINTLKCNYSREYKVCVDLSSGLFGPGERRMPGRTDVQQRQPLQE